MKTEIVMTQEYWERNYKRNYRKQLRKELMRKCKTTMIVCFLVGSFLLASGSDFYEETGQIERKGVFYEVDGEQFIHTDDGHVWEVFNYDFPNGKKVTVRFFTNWSENVKDYEVVKVHRRWF